MKHPRSLLLALVTLTASIGLAAPAHAQVRPLIQGVVVDQGGQNVDDVTVLAVRPDGSVAASALTYASNREDGPQHGYFFLAVGEPGLYTVTLAKDGYRPADLGQQTISRARGVVSLGEVELTRRPSPTITSVTLDDARITTEQRPGLTVAVRGAAGRPVGQVVVKVDGRAAATQALRSRDRGSVHVSLSRLTRGGHQVKALFRPSSAYVAGSSSSAKTVTVTKPGRHRTSARAWIPGSPLLRLLP